MTLKKVVSPTLETIKMIENTIKDFGDEIKNLAQLKKLLPRQVNHYALKEVLKYLESCNRIMFTSQGMVWLPDYKRKGTSLDVLRKLQYLISLNEFVPQILVCKLSGFL